MSSPEQKALKVWAASPHAMDGATRLARLFWLRKMCLPSPPARILDIGSGQDAGILNWVAGDVVGEDLGIGVPEMENHAGIDVNVEFIEYTRKHRKGTYEVFDLLDIGKEGKRLPFQDNSFDVVLATEVMEHLFEQDWLPVLYELERVSHKQILITVPDGGRDGSIDVYPGPPANTLYEGHQYEPGWKSFQRLVRVALPAGRIYFRKILGFFTACCYVD